MESSSCSSSTHRSGTNTSSSELFICFTSRNHNSAMKASSKSSILSPGRVRDPPISLSSSLSRKLRTSGSIKNGQASPMFPTGSKKRGPGFENPEPSSPKVTCIGQVRVKTKKQGKKMRNLSRRRNGEVMSFRKIEHNNSNNIQRQSSVNSQYECSSHRNQRWVHLPLTICETLKGFGSELFPCKSSCFSGEKRERVGRESSYDLEKWLVVNGESSGKRRDADLVVGDDDESEGIRRSLKRHVFDEIEIQDYDEESGRVSICIPPKNALLLMRCRSDPVKMEALANKFWEPKLRVEDEDDDENIDSNIEQVVEKENVVHVEKVFDERRASVSYDTINEVEEDMKLEMEVKKVNEEEKQLVDDLHVNEEMHEDSEEEEKLEENLEQVHEEEEKLQVLGEQEEESEAHKVVLVEDEEQVGEEEEEESEARKVVLVEDEEENGSSFVTALEVLASQENDVVVVVEEEEEEEEESRVSYSCNSFFVNSNDDEICKPGQEEQEEEIDNQVALEFDPKESSQKETEESAQVLERESDRKIKKVETETTQRLPECLLLMMCEPKLSMEVSKETWVCSTDFIRWRPQKKKPHAPPHQHKKSAAGDEEPVIKKRNSVDSKCSSNNSFAALPPPYPAAIQPGRSSCSLPAASAAVSMATMIEQKLVDAVAYEPFVLTRCKSEPMRTASKLAQEACFWKNRAMEPHRRATYGVGAAGIGC